jgi:hypothetical protein
MAEFETTDESVLETTPYTPYEPEQTTSVRGVAPSAPENEKFEWKVQAGSQVNFPELGRRLAAANPKLFRNGKDGHGLVLVKPDHTCRSILKAGDLDAVIADTVPMSVTKDGKFNRPRPAPGEQNAMLQSELFLGQFPAVDEVTQLPTYLDGFRLAAPGLNSDANGDSVLYLGPTPTVAETMQAVTDFLDEMAFASNADRTNTVGAALTLVLRRFWPGAKAVVLVTATKSHSGKGTIIDFIKGRTATAEILYEKLDWTMQTQCQRQLQANPAIGLINFDNVRLDSAGGGGCIRGGFVESFVTNKEINLAAPGVGKPFTARNRFVVAINTNDGALSGDLLNRSLPIHLAPQGNVHDRKPRIGNPKLEYLPKYQLQIEAELLGMIERWKKAGQPLDESIRHPMSPWARTVGGILRANGFSDFLENYGSTKLVNDPIREALGILGAAKPDEALKPGEWAELAKELGLAQTLFHQADRDTLAGRERAIGKLMAKYLGETLEAAKDGRRYQFRLDGGQKRWVTGSNPHVRYRFNVLDTAELDVDEDSGN